MMNPKQQRILMRSSLAMGVTVAVGMLAFGQVTGAPRATRDSALAVVEAAPAAQVADVVPPEPDPIVTDVASASVVSDGPAYVSQEFSRVARDGDDDDDEHEREEHRDSFRNSERRERR